MPSKLAGYSLVLVSAAMFGSYGIWSRLMGDHFRTFFQAYAKSAIILLVLVPILLYRREILAVRRQEAGWMAAFLGSTAFTVSTSYYAFNHMPIANATLLFYVSTLLVISGFGFVVFRESVTPAKIMGGILAVAGLAVTCWDSLGAFPIAASVCAIASGAMSGVEIAASKRLSERYTSLYLSVLVWGTILVANLVVALAIDEPRPLLAANIEWAYMAGFSLASIVGFWTVMEGMRRIDAHAGGLAGLTEVLFGIGFAYLIFAETPSARTFAGAALILMAAMLPHLDDMWRAHGKSAAAR